MPLFRIALLALPSLLAAGCATGTDSDPQPAPPPAIAATIDVFRSAGSRQCEGGGDALVSLQARLEAAGIPVTAAACGTDGRMYASVCGAPDGRIGIFSVPRAHLDAARAAGFLPLADLPDAQRVDCD